MSLRTLFHIGFSRPLVSNFRPFLQKTRCMQPSKANWVALGLFGSGLFSVANCIGAAAEPSEDLRPIRRFAEQPQPRPLAEHPWVCQHAASEMMRILQENAVRPIPNISQLLSAHTLTLQQCNDIGVSNGYKAKVYPEIIRSIDDLAPGDVRKLIAH